MYREKCLAVLEEDGLTRIQIFDSFRDLVEHNDLESIVIDVPIGLADSGPRSCDVWARRFVGKRGSSVFPAPIRPMLKARTYEEAQDARRRVDGVGCSLQTYSILPVIRQVDTIMTGELQQRVREGHPEVSFRKLAGYPMEHKKKSRAGRDERIASLKPHFMDLEDRLSALKRRDALNDVIDAYAMLFTARHVRDGSFETFPPEPELDPRGLRMEIVY
jgi:predicted RNase H-like nuclease